MINFRRPNSKKPTLDDVEEEADVFAEESSNVLEKALLFVNKQLDEEHLLINLIVQNLGTCLTTPEEEVIVQGD